MNTTYQNQSNGKVKSIRNFFFWSAGAVIPILEKCPSEQIKYTAIGVMMFFISLLSCVSFTIFLTISFEFNPFLALIGGVIWACLIFCLERVVLTSFRKGETSVITIVLRFVLVLSTAFVIGEPLVLSFYAKEIKLEMISQNRSIVTNARQEITARYQEEVSNLESSNNNIQARLDLLKKDRDDKQNAITEEVEGKSRTGRSGYGIAAKQKEDAFNDANAKYNEYKIESVEILRQNNARLSEIRKEIEDQTKITAETAKGADGILARQEALSSLIRNKSGVATFYFACLAILILLETIPLIFKVFGKKNGYEIALDGEEAKEIVFIQQDKKFVEENLIRSRKLQSGQAERLLRILIAGKIDEISDVAERRVAETLKAEALRMTENEAFNRQAALFGNDDFADEITVEIVGHEDFKVSLHVPKNANKTLSLKTLSGDINKIAAAIGEKLQLAKAFSSAKREISANLPLLSQLENDAKLILEFEPI